MTVIIKTDQPILKDRVKTMHLVANFWDKISEGWHKIWGPHIHHGYYEEMKETPLEAQEKLITKLTELLEILPNSKILDIGCGMGGSSFYLAKQFNASVNGITLSNKQMLIANKFADEKKIKTVQFSIEDALSLASFNDNSFDIAWSLESCEQFFDKELFIKQVYRKLKSGGQLLLATWCSDQEQYQEKSAQKYKKLCTAFDLPYMPTMEHYKQLLTQRGFHLQHYLDWSEKVKRSWDIGISLLDAYSFLKILKTSGWRGLRFTKQIKMMRDAFNEGRVKYGVFVAVKK